MRKWKNTKIIFVNLLEKAKSQNLILKYIASFDNGKASVGLQSIDEKS